DAQYLLSRTGTRAELVVARWAFYAMVGAGLLFLMALAATTVYELDPASQASVPWALVPTFETAGYPPLFSPPSAAARYGQWVSQGKTAATYGFATVTLPWLAAPLLALSFLGFLVGALSWGVAGPPRAGWSWRRLLEPRVWASGAPYAAAFLFLAAPGFAG